MERGRYDLYLTILAIFIGTLYDLHVTCVRHTDGFELRLLHKNKIGASLDFCNKYLCNADESDDFMIRYDTL